MVKDEFGDRMKAYERVRSEDRLDRGIVYARLDGRGFSNFTRGMIRPFDGRMTRFMIDVTKYLVERTGASMGYTQSDEISLVWDVSEAGGFLFDGKIQKLASTLAAMASSKFMLDLSKSSLADFADRLPHFDCRIFNLPSRTEGANALLWREQDCRKNSITMAASEFFSHKELQGVSGERKIEMMEKIGFPYQIHPIAFRHGTFIRVENHEVAITSDMVAHIPEKHRPAIGTKMIRSKTVAIELPPFSMVKNRTEFVFDKAEPHT